MSAKLGIFVLFYCGGLLICPEIWFITRRVSSLRFDSGWLDFSLFGSSSRIYVRYFIYFYLFLSILIYFYLFLSIRTYIHGLKPDERQPAPGVGKEILVNVPMELESELSSMLAGLAKQKAGLNTEQKTCGENIN